MLPSGPKMPQDGPRSLPKIAQNLLKTLPKLTQNPPRTAPGPPKIRQDHPRTAQDIPRKPKATQYGSKYTPKTAHPPPRPPQVPPEVLINWRGGTKAQPSSIRRPTGVGVLDWTHGFCQSFLPSSFRILLLGGSCFPLLNPPPVASGRLHLLRRSAALARLGASWAEKIGFQEALKN